MKEKNRDILADNPKLKEQVYSVPDGYFSGFKAGMTPYASVEPSLARRLVPYLSMAAVFIFLVTAGTFFLQQTTPADEFTQEDFILYSSNISGIGLYEEEPDQLADAGIADEDIIEYLIYSGISAEEIELSK
ncbi:MAG: hypothetical protein IKA34_10410 [Bacteroidales bacterium]|nr:hypothetical protein [Bacteroidales bacterium]